MTLYHGTSKDAALNIKANGFIPSECSDFGIAVYFSDRIDWAEQYAHKNGVILEVSFTGNLLDLSIPEHFELYRKTGNAIPKQWDALKDGHNIAVYDLRTLSIS